MKIHGLRHICARDAWYKRAIWCALFHSRPHLPPGWHDNGGITVSNADGRNKEVPTRS